MIKNKDKFAVKYNEHFFCKTLIGGVWNMDRQAAIDLGKKDKTSVS